MLLFLERFDPFKSTVASGVLEWLGMSRSADLFSQTEGHDVLDSSLEADSSVNGEKSFLEQIIIVRTKGQSYSWHFISSHTSLYDQPDLWAQKRTLYVKIALSVKLTFATSKSTSQETSFKTCSICDSSIPNWSAKILTRSLFSLRCISTVLPVIGNRTHRCVSDTSTSDILHLPEARASWLMPPLKPYCSWDNKSAYITILVVNVMRWWISYAMS